MTLVVRGFQMNTIIRIILNKKMYRPVLLAILGLFLFIAAGFANEDQHELSSKPAQAKEPIQTKCPVIIGNKIDLNIFTDYEGKRVYFCCNSCKSMFKKNPEKYLHRLPQLKSVNAAHHDNGSHQHGNGLLVLSVLVVPMGIATLSLVAITVFLSVFRRLRPHLMLKWHKRFGFISLISGAIHAILVLLTH